MKLPDNEDYPEFWIIRIKRVSKGQLDEFLDR
ncbi:hypothetical protein HNR44_002953 [Geomicrobium halophilum]|uniref:Uncharacterized protein n=1 Tax=Geomicrobium halophilum TaxID=549000 RepID=A0A841Q086_9BACL|nr:hypothetical protein [Geomicrobium halophilum]